MTITENENSVIQLLRKRYNLVYELLRVTKLVTLSGDEKKVYEDAEEYTFLMEKREGMFAAVKQLNKELQSSGHPNDERSASVPFRMEIAEIRRQTDEVINELISIDKANQKIAENALDGLRKSIKGMKEGRNIQIAYQGGYDFSDGYHFDRKQ